MKISIITVVFNNAQLIEHCLTSVLSQVGIDLEYIVVDGASTDGTLEIVSRFAGVSKVISEPDNGIYDAMNKGIAYATGDVIGILNSDDFYAGNDVLKTVGEMFTKNKALDMVYGNLEYVNREDVSNTVRRWISCSYYPTFFEDGHVPPHPSLFVKRQLYEQAGSFNITYKLASDYELMLRLFRKHHFKSAHINRVFVKMRLGGATNKNLKNILNGNREIYRSWTNNSLKCPYLMWPKRIYRRLVQFYI